MNTNKICPSTRLSYFDEKKQIPKLTIFIYLNAPEKMLLLHAGVIKTPKKMTKHIIVQLKPIAHTCNK
jgi:hypothetical protein